MVGEACVGGESREVLLAIFEAVQNHLHAQTASKLGHRAADVLVDHPREVMGRDRQRLSEGQKRPAGVLVQKVTRLVCKRATSCEPGWPAGRSGGFIDVLER